MIKWFKSLSPAAQTVLENVAMWSVAGAIIWYVARGLSFARFLHDLENADLPLFLSINLLSFFIWWLGETYLFACLFSYFHKRSSFREVLPASSAQYFLQAINILIATGALVVFLNRRKGVPWITAGWTMLFMGFIDAILLSSMFVAAALLMPQSAIAITLPYAGASLAFFLLFAAWWAHGRSITPLGRWLRNRPGLHAFRTAGWREYVKLGLIRLAIFVPQAPLFYLELKSFHANIPIDQVFALTPAMLLAAGVPMTPSGLGPMQAVMVGGLSRFAPRMDILAAGLSMSVMHLLCRLPLGIGAAGTFVRYVVYLEGRKGYADGDGDHSAVAEA